MVVKSINYAALIDEAMHIIVKKSLEIAIGNQLPGDHHFFISFMTEYPGVIISDRLKKKYPKEMTIVLQYQFEDLTVEDHEFSVVLSFDNIKERIVIPFMALTAFADPSVKFGLQFRHIEENLDEEDFNNEALEEDFNSNLNDIDVTKQPSKQNAVTEEIIKKSGATNVIALDKFRNKNKK